MAANLNAETKPGARSAENYRFLEWRPTSWRRQPYLAGRRMTVANVVFGMRANNLTPEEAAEAYDLPLEQVQEALLFYERHPDIIQDDQDDERRYLESKGCLLDPPPAAR